MRGVREGQFRLYDPRAWMALVLSWGQHRRATVVLAAVSFTESFFSPIPPDVLLVPMVLARRAKAFILAGITTLTSVLGGIVGYGLGLLFFDTIGRDILTFYGVLSAFDDFVHSHRDAGLWWVAAGGFTILPYKVVTIAAGALALDLPDFVLVSLLSRGSRFFLVATLLWLWGDQIKGWCERSLVWWVSLGFLILTAGMWVWWQS